MEEVFNQYPELQLFLTRFVELLKTSENIRSIILFGGISLGDFSKKYSDIDLVVTLEKEPTVKEIEEIQEIFFELRAQNEVLTKLLYVYFIPIEMIENPDKMYQSKQGLIIREKGKKAFNQYPLSVTDTFTIFKYGKILFGKNDKQKFPNLSSEVIFAKFKEDLPSIESATFKYPFQYSEVQCHEIAVNWILYFPRLLYSITEKDVISKHNGAFWFSDKYSNDLGRFVVNVAKCRRSSISLDKIGNLVEKSVQLLLFSLEQVLQIMGKKSLNLADLVETNGEIKNFKLVFKKLDELF